MCTLVPEILRLFWRNARRYMFLAMVALIGACTNVTESSLLYQEGNRDGAMIFGCRSALGGYFLPKSFITFQIDAATTTGSSKVDYVLHDVAPVVQADTRRAYCLDYLASSFADDLVTVSRSNGTANQSQQLLQSVSSSAVDQTSIIIRKIIRTAFTAMSASGLRVAADTTPNYETVADFTFDPFDQLRSAQINDQIRHFGFCFVLEVFTFGAAGDAPVQQYCSNPLGTINPNDFFARKYMEYESADLKPHSYGIVYRPRTTYELSVYAKDDPDSRTTPWRLRQTMAVALENISPVISIGVDRTIFTEKQVSLGFAQGDLINICVYKKSELYQAVQIPLEVVKSIVALPNQILQIQYDQITQSSALVAAEQKILASQNRQLALLANPATATDPGAPKGPPAIPQQPATPPQTTLGAIQMLQRTGAGDFASCRGIAGPTAAAAPAKSN